MIDPDDAIAYAHQHFPEGPEKLAGLLNAEIREAQLSGCDGWCLPHNESPIIRLNSSLAGSRKRFTLAHELGHLVLDIPTVANETVEDMLSSDSAEERRVNQFASELLVPPKEIIKSIKQPPVVAKSLERLAKRANVSPVMVAVRVTNLADQIGLDNAAVVQFKNGNIEWTWSPVLRFKAVAAVELLTKTQKVAPDVYRRQQKGGKVVVASTIDNKHYGSTTLFIQLLSEEQGLSKSSEERRRELEEQLFPENGPVFRQMQGCFGAYKSKAVGLTLRQAEQQFWERYRERFSSTSLNSSVGRKYVHLRLAEWCE